MNSTSKRLFVAVRPPASLTHQFHQSQRELQLRLVGSEIRKPGRVRWTPEDHMHVTLAFSAAFPPEKTAAFPPEKIASLYEALAHTAARSNPFPIRLAAPRTRPALGRPKLIWTPIEEGAASLDQLNVSIRAAFTETLPGCLLPEKRKFVPHLTLGRVSKGVSLGFGRAIRRAIRAGIQPSPPWQVGEFQLIESSLEIGGASHNLLERFPFAASA